MPNAVTILRTFQQSGSQIFLDAAGQLRARRLDIGGTETSLELDSTQGKALRSYLGAKDSARRSPLTTSDTPPRPSPYQQVWWNLDASTTEDFPYAHFPTAVDLGICDDATAMGAIRALLARHRVLRSVFLIRDGRLAVEFCAPDDVAVETMSVESEAELYAAVRVKAAGIPAITQAPPLRIHLIRHGARCIVCFVFHHIIFDYVSAGILKAELKSGVHGQGAACEDVPRLPDFYDWAAWERQWLEGPGGQRVCRYWRDWRDRIPTLRSPSGASLDWIRGTRTKHGVRLNWAFLEKLAVRARHLRTTSFIIVLSAYVVALHRWSGRDHFPVRAVGNSRVGALAATGIGLFMCHDLMEVDMRGLAGMDDLVRAICAEYRSSVALRIPTHMSGSGADYDTLHSTVGASINFVPGIFRPATAPPSQEPAILLSETGEAPIHWPVPQPTIVLELFGAQEGMSGAMSFNDGIIGAAEQRSIAGLFCQAMRQIIEASAPIQEA